VLRSVRQARSDATRKGTMRRAKAGVARRGADGRECSDEVGIAGEVRQGSEGKDKEGRVEVRSAG
jgi:hypothetical protein